MKKVKQTENGGGKMTLEEQIKYYRKQAGRYKNLLCRKQDVAGSHDSAFTL